MRGKYFRFCAVVLVLLGGMGSYVVVGLHLFSSYQIAYGSYEDTCGTLVRWSPPKTLYTAFYANGPALVTLQYRSATPETLTFTLGIPSLTAQQTAQVQATPTPQLLTFKPPLLGSQALDALVGPRQRAGEITLTVAHGAKHVCDTTAPLTLMSRQWMHWAGPPTWNNARYLAGWVTPQDSDITGLIGSTSATISTNPDRYPMLTRLAGYDANRATPEMVREQVDAIFDTLQFVYHVHYAQDNVPFLTHADEIVQLPHDILSSSNPTGMCVETTAILASAVERLGMRPSFILIPGHVFLGVALSTAPHAPMAYWETSDLNGGITGHQANIHGDTEYATHQAQGDIEDVIDVSAARAAGIQPIE